MGEGKALRIVEWLRQHQDSIGLQFGRHVAVSRSKLYAHELQAVVPSATDIRPLEKFIVPAELGSTFTLILPRALASDSEGSKLPGEQNLHSKDETEQQPS